MHVTQIWLSFSPSSRALIFDPPSAWASRQPLLRAGWPPGKTVSDLLYSHAHSPTSGSVWPCLLLSIKESPILPNSELLADSRVRVQICFCWTALEYWGTKRGTWEGWGRFINEKGWGQIFLCFYLLGKAGSLVSHVVSALLWLFCSLRTHGHGGEVDTRTLNILDGYKELPL